MLQSGSEMSETNTDENLEQVAINLNCTTETTELMAECLREKTPDELRRAHTLCEVRPSRDSVVSELQTVRNSVAVHLTSTKGLVLH